MQTRFKAIGLIVLSVHLLLGVGLNEAGQIVYDDSDDIIWVEGHCVESMKDNDVYDVQERQDQFGCWPDDAKRSTPGPPKDLTVEVVYTNQSGLCSAVLHVSWNAPQNRINRLTGFSLTMISVDLLPRAPCVTLIDRYPGSIQKNALNTTFSYNCLMLPFEIGFQVIVDSLPRSSNNSISSERVIARSTDEQCRGSTYANSPATSVNVSSAPVKEESTQSASTFIRPFTVSDLAIIVPLSLIGLILVVLVGLYIGCYRRRHSQANEWPIHEPSSNLCDCARCQLERRPAMTAPDKMLLIDNTSFSRSASSYSCESV